MEIKVSNRPEKDDYFRFSLNHIKKRMIIVPAIGIFLFSVLYLIIYLDLGPYYWPQELTVYYVLFVLFMAGLLPLINILTIRVAANRQYRTTMHTNRELTIGDEGLQSHSELGDMRLPWSHIHRATESKSAVYLYLSSAQAIILPERDFTAEQYAMLHELCRRYIPPKRNRLKY
jgi:hypothetical protein